LFAVNTATEQTEERCRIRTFVCYLFINFGVHCVANQVSLGRADEVLQTAMLDSSISLNVYHAVATLKNLNRNGILCR